MPATSSVSLAKIFAHNVFVNINVRDLLLYEGVTVNMSVKKVQNLSGLFAHL